MKLLTSAACDIGIREWYMSEYPPSKVGLRLSGTTTINDIINAINDNGDIYELMGVPDDLHREKDFLRDRIFEKIATEMGINFRVVHSAWLWRDI